MLLIVPSEAIFPSGGIAQPCIGVHRHCIALHRYALVLHSLTQVCTVVNSLCLTKFREVIFYLSWPWFSSSAPFLPLLPSCLLFPGSVSSRNTQVHLGAQQWGMGFTGNQVTIISLQINTHQNIQSLNSHPAPLSSM